MTPFHAFEKKRKKEANGVVLNGTINLLLPLDVQRTGEEEAIMFPCNATISISLCPHLPKNTWHNPYPHSPTIMMKKREGMPHPAAAGVVVQKPPHATLPCTLMRQGRVASLSSCLLSHVPARCMLAIFVCFSLFLDFLKIYQKDGSNLGSNKCLLFTMLTKQNSLMFSIVSFVKKRKRKWSHYLGRLAHTCSQWSILTGDLPTHTHTSFLPTNLSSSFKPQQRLSLKKLGVNMVKSLNTIQHFCKSCRKGIAPPLKNGACSYSAKT